jgi:Xanthine dehydrogenase, molybdopterin-binding subunit B
MLVVEEIIDRVARETGLTPEVVRARNLYRGSGETNTTHYGQEIEDNRIQRIWNELTERASSPPDAKTCDSGTANIRIENGVSP